MKRHNYPHAPLVILLVTLTFVFFGYACDGGSSSSSSSSGGGCDGGSSSSGGGGECAQWQSIDWWSRPEADPPSGPYGAPPSGPHEVVLEQDPNFDTHTIYRPVGATNMPIVVWGNGGCAKNGTGFAEFLAEVASHGFLVVADGAPGGGSGSGGCGGGGGGGADGTPLIQAMDWAIEQNGKTCSPVYKKVNTTKIAAMGQSCGGLMTYQAAADPRLTTIVLWNSGLFERDQQIYDSIHTPVAMFLGGTQDIAYENGTADFNAINKVPFFYGSLELGSLGHIGTFIEDNAGEFGRVGAAWLKWQLRGETGPGGAAMFVGSNCGLCDTEWTIKKKNME
jgi:dienelactone hydrolase